MSYCEVSIVLDNTMRTIDLDYDDEITVEGKALLVELEKRLPNYELHNGDIVFIGTEEYEIRTINDERAVLVDISFPLITKEMSREEFDKKVKENPANDKLRTGTIKTTQNDFSKNVDKETPKKDKTFLGIQKDRAFCEKHETPI